jgi:hypothetical protein
LLDNFGDTSVVKNEHPELDVVSPTSGEGIHSVHNLSSLKSKEFLDNQKSSWLTPLQQNRGQLRFVSPSASIREAKAGARGRCEFVS